MIIASNSKYKNNIVQYGMLLTKYFERFNVPLFDEDDEILSSPSLAKM